jgi:hypothetical protein
MTDLAVIVVNWNTRDLTLQTLESLYTDLAATALGYQVWVVDNASSDGSVAAIQAQFPPTQIIASPENLGFAKGNNAALRALGFDGPDAASESLPKAVYLLNSDTITQPGATLCLYQALMSLPQAGVVGARLTYGDGGFQHSAFAFPGLAQLWLDLLPAPGRLYESHWNGRYPQALYQAGQPFEVGHTLGATMLLKREVIQQTGLFDEQFHMYCEEVDWSWRIRRAGWQIYCIPKAHVIHLGGQSTRQVRARSLLNLWTARLQLYRKHYPAWKLALAKRIIRAGMQRKLAQFDQDASLSDDLKAELMATCQAILDQTQH